MTPPPQYPPQQQQYPPRPPAAKSNVAAIVIGVVLGFCALAGLGIFAAIRFIHHEKEVVVAKAATYGIDLSSHPSSHSARSGQSVKTCEIAPKDLVAPILAEPIERVEPGDAGLCMYFGPAGLAAKLAKEEADKTSKEVQGGNSKVDIPDLARVFTGAVETARAKNGEVPLLMIVISRGDGRAVMNALAVNKAIWGQIPGGVLSDVPDLGDRAIRGANLGLSVLKGEDILRIYTASLPDAHAKEIALARALLPKM
jgi:hypothetical protein